VTGADSLTLGQLIGWIRDGGVIACLIIVVYGAISEWWVTGRQYRRVIRERDELQRELFHVLGLTDRATRALDRATNQALSGSWSDDDRSGNRRIEAERDVRLRGQDEQP
jgi:hypothetical protein